MEVRSKMKVNTFSLGPLGTNCYVLSKEGHALVIDPGGDSHIITEFLQKEALKLDAILLTHAHFDHIGGLDQLRKAHQVNVYMHELEKEWLENPELNRSLLFFGTGEGIITAPPEHLLTEGHHQVGNFEFDIIHTPGHSPGSISFVFPSDNVVVSGDVLFHHGIGRTDIPEGSIEELAHSIMNKLYKLPDDYTVYPGHGTSTKIGIEKTTNPHTNQF